jgi:phage FluMu gp28-like protein
MWAAARPVITWGFPMRIFSTHNGKGSLFNKFIERIRKGKLRNWSLHSVDIHKAVREGLLDKIRGRATSDEERAEWIQELHDDCVDEDTWLQEYCCIPTDESTAFLPYDLIASCESDETLWTGSPSPQGDLYLGFDVARKKHLSVIWINEKLGDVPYTRRTIVMENTPFRAQRDILYEWLRHPRLRRACIDSTGIGAQLAEEAQSDFGRFRVEPVTFTGPVKEDLAYRLRNRMEDRRFVIPRDETVRASFHSIRKVVTAAGNVRFDVNMNESVGHADHFWAAALANHASEELSSAPVEIMTSGPRMTATILRGY